MCLCNHYNVSRMLSEHGQREILIQMEYGKVQKDAITKCIELHARCG